MKAAGRSAAKSLGLALFLIAAAASAAPLENLLAPYREAQRTGEVGSIVGRVTAERRTPNGTATPIASTSIVLLPHSEEFVATIETIKRAARDTLAAYRSAAADIRKAREAYERRLWDAGAPDLVRPATVATDGGFRFDDVPAGRWMIVATHGLYYGKGGSPHAPTRERLRFDATPRQRGFTATQVWLRQVDVTKGAVDDVELSDRNLWFSGIVEDKERDAGR